MQQPIEVILPENQPSQFYKSIINLPLFKFMECDVDNNLSALIISGIPTPDELTNAWIDIQQEYSDAMGSYEQRLQAELYVEVNILEWNHRLCVKTIELLRVVFSQKFADELNALLNRRFVFDPNNIEDYNEKLDLCENYTKGLWLQYQLKSSALKVDEPNGKIKKSTKESYYSVLNIIGDAAHVVLDDKIYTFSFCDRYKRHVDRVNKQNAVKH